MDEAEQDFEVQAFVRSLFEDLTLTLPHLGCRFAGQVAGEALVVRHPLLALRNRLFLYFADWAAAAPVLEVTCRVGTASAAALVSFAAPGAAVPAPAGPPGTPTWQVNAAPPWGFQLSLVLGAAPDPLPVLDLARLRQLYETEADATEILRLLGERAPLLWSGLSLAWQAGDAGGVLRGAHSLKGTARGAAAPALAQAALALETAVRGGSLDGAADLYKAVQATYDALMHRLSEGL